MINDIDFLYALMKLFMKLQKRMKFKQTFCVEIPYQHTFLENVFCIVLFTICFPKCFIFWTVKVVFVGPKNILVWKIQ